MHRSVELELEEVDCIQDQQLLQKANVSPFFTGARPPYTMLSELDFSPQAISRATDNFVGASKTTSFHSVPPLSLDCTSFSTCPSYSNSSLSSGGFEPKPLSRVSSWQELNFAGQDQSPGRLHGSSAPAEEYGGSRTDSLLSPLYEYHRNETLGCLPSLYDDEHSGRGKPCGYRYENPEMFEYHNVHISPFKDELNILEPATPSKRVIVTDSDLRLFAPNATLANNTRSQHEFWESNNHSYLVTSAPVFRSLETPRFRREKMFPQHNENSFLVPKSASSGCSSTNHQVTPFPAESLSLATNEPKRHNAFKKQSPLPDAHRTVKTKRASKEALFCTLPNQSPMTELTKKYSRGSDITQSFSERPQLCRLPGLQQSHMQTSGLADFGALPGSQIWHRERSAQFSPQQSGYYGQFPGFAIPSLQPSRVLYKRKIGAYSPEARQERIKRFHQKRKERVFHKRIKYDCRKRLANACPRIKGRFVKQQDFDESIAQAYAQAESDQTPLPKAE